MQEILIDGDRLIAFLIIDGRVYESDCDHQECLAMYYEDIGKTPEIDCSSEKFHEKAVKVTYELKESHEAYGFDLFQTYSDEYILLAHDKETMDANLEWMKKYQKENAEYDIRLAYFTEGFNAKLI